MFDIERSPHYDFSSNDFSQFTNTRQPTVRWTTTRVFWPALPRWCASSGSSPRSGRTSDSWSGWPSSPGERRWSTLDTGWCSPGRRGRRVPSLCRPRRWTPCLGRGCTTGCARGRGERRGLTATSVFRNEFPPENWNISKLLLFDFKIDQNSIDRNYFWRWLIDWLID